MFYEDRQIKPEKIVLFTKTFGFYTTLALIPFKNTFYHSFLQSAAGALKHKAYTMKCRFFWIGVAWMALITWYLSSHIYSWDLICFGITWWILGISPFCNAFRISQEIAERYIYFANVGLMFCLASFIHTNPVIAASFIAMYATKMWFYMDAYQDDFYLTEHASLGSPDAWFSWHVKAMKRWDAGSHQEAIIFWLMGKKISPNEFKLNVNLATACAVAGHKAEGEKFLEIAEKNINRGQEEQAGRIVAEWRQGKFAILL
jgi:hypothetical protein